MREILFRGKTDDGEWVYGSFCMDAREQFNGLCGVDGFIRLYDKEKGKMQSYEVERDTVGQYTGLKDKNGKKIFEGDIVDILTENEEIGVIEYDDGGFQVEADGFIVDFHANINGTDLEVIGNVHDNQELMEAQNEFIGTLHKENPWNRIPGKLP